MKCNRCGREISADESHSYRGQTLCDDCFIDVTSHEQEKTCDPWATYVTSKERAGARLKGAEGLSETENKIYEFIRSKGRATREEVIAELSLSAQDMEPQLKVLMHSELIKERSEGGTMYLIPIG